MDARNQTDGKRLVILTAGVRLVVEPDGPSSPPRPPNVPPIPLWLFFTPVELEIVKLLAGAPPLKTAAIAARLPDAPETELKFALASLVKRCVLVSSTTDGYSLNASEAERAELRSWLTGQDPDGC